MGNMSKREQVLTQKNFGNLEVLGNSSFRSDYVQCKCSCGQVCDINFYNILDGKRTCCKWCKSSKTIKAREIKKFHHLTVIGHGESASALLCKCACGITKDISAKRLLTGESKTCGCGYGRSSRKLQCMSTKVFGRLEVIGESEIQGRVLCKCSCGKTTNPSISSLLKGDTKSCGCLRREESSVRMKEKATMEVGQRYAANSGEVVEVVNYEDCDNVYIKFPDGTINKASAGNIRKGEVNNPNKPSVCGVGFFGEGQYTSKHKSYSHWNHMMQRCYSNNYGHTYQDAIVTSEWHNYQNFAKWFYDHWKLNDDVALDKDILIKGNKVYSPDYCSLIPENLNNFTCKADTIRGNLPIGVRARTHKSKTTYLAMIFKYNKNCFIGEFDCPEKAFFAYKDEKECHAKVLADYYTNKGLITEEVRKALYEYLVEITD